MFNRTFRWTFAKSVVDLPITVSNLIGMYNFCTTATNLTVLCTAMKVKYVELWAEPDPSAASRVDLEWVSSTGGFAGPSAVISDTTLGTALPAHLKSRPPPMSLMAQWLQPTTGTLFTVSGNIGSIMDINLTYCLQDGLTAGASKTVAGATSGIVYVVSPDGVLVSGAPAFTAESMLQI